MGDRGGDSVPDDEASAVGDAAPSGDPAVGESRASLARTHSRVRQRFSGAGEAYVASASHAGGEELARMVEAARARLGALDGRRALDVATGGGHTARALAEAGASVVASDLTPQMLGAAEAHLRERLPQAELSFVVAAAEDLPFEDGAFDVVACRIAAHHFAGPRGFLAEARRVLAPGGVFLLVDNVAPEDAYLARAMNEVERLRDASHVEAYPVSRWVGWAAEAGLEPFLLERFWRVKELERWLQRAGTSDRDEAALRGLLREGPERVQRYLLAPGESAERPGRLRHEVMLLAAAADPFQGALVHRPSGGRIGR